MKKTVLALVALTVAMASCGDGSLSVTDYNEKAISIYNPLDTKISNAFQGFTPDAANKEKNLTTINSCTKAIDSARTQLEKLKAPKEALPLHQALLNIVRYEKDTMMPLFTRVVNEVTNPEAAQKIQQETMSASARATTLVSEMQQEQQKLAASIGAKIH